MLVPGLSTEQKLIIQKKLDNILNKEYISICPKFIKQIDRFNGNITQNFLNEKRAKLTAKLSKYFYLRRNPENKLKLILNLDTNLSEVEHVKKIIYKSFTINELLIIFNNLDYFIKDEKIREIFPKLKNSNFHDIYSKELTEKTPLKKIDKKLNLVSKIKDDTIKNNAINRYYLKKERINKIFLDFNKKVRKERKDLLKKELKDIKRKNYFRKTMNKMNYDINNISKISNSKEFSFEHPLIEYYFDKKKKEKKSNILNYKNNFIHCYRIKNLNLYKNMINENKNTSSFIKNNGDNLLNNKIKEKNMTQRKIKKIGTLRKRFNNDFQINLYKLRKNNSNLSYNNNFDISNNYLKNSTGRNYNSFKLE